jgi:hypothetical protein
MIKVLLRGVLSAIAVTLLGNYRRLSIQLLKIAAAKSYLHGVRMARMSVIGLILMGLLLVLIGVGVLLFHAGLFILLPWPLEAKAVLALVLGMVYGVLGVGALCASMGEKTWMEKSGAAKMLKEATGRSDGD